jgi:hypothetical protein
MAKKLAIIFGIIFVLVGILGFFTNPIVGAGQNAIFMTDTMHNIVHLLVGIILVLAGSMSEKSASLWLKIFGVVYLILFIDGLIQPDKLLGFVMANQNDTWLHLVLGVVLLVAGFAAKGGDMVMMDRSTM